MPLPVDASPAHTSPNPVYLSLATSENPTPNIAGILPNTIYYNSGHAFLIPDQGGGGGGGGITTVEGVAPILATVDGDVATISLSTLSAVSSNIPQVASMTIDTYGRVTAVSNLGFTPIGQGQASTITAQGISSLISGPINFTGPLTGPNPMAPNQLATRAYVDAQAGDGGVFYEAGSNISITAPGGLSTINLAVSDDIDMNGHQVIDSGGITGSGLLQVNAGLGISLLAGAAVNITSGLTTSIIGPGDISIGSGLGATYIENYKLDNGAMSGSNGSVLTLSNVGTAWVNELSNVSTVNNNNGNITISVTDPDNNRSIDITNATGGGNINITADVGQIGIQTSNAVNIGQTAMSVNIGPTFFMNGVIGIGLGSFGGATQLIDVINIASIQNSDGTLQLEGISTINGIPVNTSSISSVADWAAYPAVTDIDGGNNDITNVINAYISSVITADIYPIAGSPIKAHGDFIVTDTLTADATRYVVGTSTIEVAPTFTGVYAGGLDVGLEGTTAGRIIDTQYNKPILNFNESNTTLSLEVLGQVVTQTSMAGVAPTVYEELTVTAGQLLNLSDFNKNYRIQIVEDPLHPNTKNALIYVPDGIAVSIPSEGSQMSITLANSDMGFLVISEISNIKALVEQLAKDQTANLTVFKNAYDDVIAQYNVILSATGALSLFGTFADQPIIGNVTFSSMETVLTAPYIAADTIAAVNAFNLLSLGTDVEVERVLGASTIVSQSEVRSATVSTGTVIAEYVSSQLLHLHDDTNTNSVTLTARSGNSLNIDGDVKMPNIIDGTNNHGYVGAYLTTGTNNKLKWSTINFAPVTSGDVYTTSNNTFTGINTFGNSTIVSTLVVPVQANKTAASIGAFNFSGSVTNVMSGTNLNIFATAATADTITATTQGLMNTLSSGTTILGDTTVNSNLTINSSLIDNTGSSGGVNSLLQVSTGSHVVWGQGSRADVYTVADGPGQPGTSGLYVWTKPTNARIIDILLIGGGGAGGAGGNSTNTAGGGAGGAGGGLYQCSFRATEIPGSLNIQVGQGGISGTQNGSQSHVANGATVLVRATFGSNGGGGSGGGGGGSPSGGLYFQNNGVGGAFNGNGLSGNSGNIGGSSGGSGGFGGSNALTTQTSGSGGTGAAGNLAGGTGVLCANSGTGLSGNDGQWNTLYGMCCSSGGGGGGGSRSGNGGAGGDAGGFGCGGGGGGGGNGGTSSLGGNGSGGLVVITTHF